MKKRERFLLVLLAALVILLGGFKFLIEPQMKKLTTAKEALVQAKADQQQAADNVRRAESVAKENGELEVKAAEVGALFFPELENDKVQIFFDGLASKAGVSFTSFSMSGRSVAAIAGFVPLEDSISYPAGENAGAINVLNGREEQKPASAAEEKKKDAQNAAALERMEVSMQFTASYNQMKAFLDAVKTGGRTARIVSVNASGSGESLGVSVSVECFGVKKITDDPLAQDTLPKAGGRANPFP